MNMKSKTGWENYRPQVSDSTLRKLGFEQSLHDRSIFQEAEWKEMNKAFSGRVKEELSRSPNTAITCPVMTVFNVAKLGGGHWTPQPPKPQHAWTQHANDLLVLYQLRTNHSAWTDWTVERLKVSISDAFHHRTEAEPPWMEQIELARHTVHCQESWVHYLPVTWQRRDKDEDV